MKPLLASVTAITVLLASAAAAQERAAEAGLGAVAGAVVLGPIGALAGAVVGYTAGPSIARSWGLRHSGTRHKNRSGSHLQAAHSTQGRLAPGANDAPSPEDQSSATASVRDVARAGRSAPEMPPVQPLE